VANTAASQYEALRRVALGEPVPAHYRSGLVLFLRRGMWSWARSLSPAVPARAPVPSASGCATAVDQRAVIQVFAAMALTVEQETAP
jgi:hypothetical protein